MARPRAGWLAIALLAGCGPTAIAPLVDAAPGGDAGPGEPDDAGPREAPPPTCALEQAPLARPADALSVLVTPDGVFLGDARGLWRASALDARFDRVTSIPGDPSPVLALVRADDGAIFALLPEGRVVTSRDEGARWEELAAVPGTTSGARTLHTDGERIVVAVPGIVEVEGLYELDRAEGRWIEIVAEDPIGGWGHRGFVLVGVDRGALLATPDGYRTTGLFRLERGAPRWEHVEGMDENGYTSVARRGDVAVVASPSGIWAEVDGTFRRVLDREAGAALLVATAEGFLGLDARGVLRSSDGIAWEVEPFADGSVRWASFLSESGGRVAALRGGEASFEPRLVSLSDDRGATWRDPSIVSQTFGRVAAHGEGDARITYVSPSAAWPYEGPSTWRRETWSSFGWPLTYGASAVAITDTGAWACAFDGCVHRTDDGEVGPTIALPDRPFAHEPASAFATSHGLFVGPRSYGTTCGAVQPGLVVLRDASTGTWEDASAGMRSWPAACPGTPSVATVTSMHELDGELWATQTQLHFGPAFQVVLRSLDGGRSWTEAREGAELAALVRAEAGAFGLFRPGVIERLDGETFAPAPSQPGAEVTDLVVLDGFLVAATAGGLWRSDDGARSWEPLVTEARIGPITDLDAHDGVLAIASSTSGLWEASGCFEE